MTTSLEAAPRQLPLHAADRLQAETAALRLSFTWFGVRKTLSAAQKEEAAESFGAAGRFLSAGKKLLDTRHPRIQAVTAVRRKAVAYFHGVSLPYPEPAIRLIRRNEIDEIQARLVRLAGDLDSTVDALDRDFHEIQEAAREHLGRLYAKADYPPSLLGLFVMSWDFPSVDPPAYLRRLAPELYKEECRRAAARFDEAVALTEQMFLAELGRLVGHLGERLSGTADGRPKVFRDSAVEHFEEFFQRFQRLNIRSSPELDEVVAQAQSLLQGVVPCELRERGALRGQLARHLTQLGAHLDGLLVDRPRRHLLRRAAAK